MYTEHFVVLLYMYKITVTDLLGFHLHYSVITMPFMNRDKKCGIKETKQQ